VEVPLFWVVHLQSASSLAQQQLRGEHLVVRFTVLASRPEPRDQVEDGQQHGGANEQDQHGDAN
jgi:hypothetical protein